MSSSKQLYIQIFSKLQALHLLALSIAVLSEAPLAHDLLENAHGDVVL